MFFRFGLKTEGQNGGKESAIWRLSEQELTHLVLNTMDLYNPLMMKDYIQLIPLLITGQPKFPAPSAQRQSPGA